MNLVPDVYLLLERIPWFSAIGMSQRPMVDFAITYLDSRDGLVGSFTSHLWADAKTEAQGDLTGYLSKHHYNAYGGYWNILARQSRTLVEKAARAKIEEGLVKNGLPVDFLQPILVDLNRAALEIAYRNKYSKVPIFFERLLRLYEAGRLPCGWNGSMADWPAGNVIAY